MARGHVLSAGLALAPALALAATAVTASESLMAQASPPEAAPSDAVRAAELPETNPAHPRYRDCGPDKNFSKRFRKTTLEDAIKKSDSDIIHASPNRLANQNPVTGIMVNSNDVYVRRSFGIPAYGEHHTYAQIDQNLGEVERRYAIYVTSTNYSTGSKNLRLNDLAEIYLPIDGQMIPVPLTEPSERGWCSYQGQGLADSCFSTGIGMFAIEAEQFEALANADPSTPIAVPAKGRDGNMLPCPLYFASLQFKAPLAMIDKEFARAAAKREEQRAEGF